MRVGQGHATAGEERLSAGGTATAAAYFSFPPVEPADDGLLSFPSSSSFLKAAATSTPKDDDDIVTSLRCTSGRPVRNDIKDGFPPLLAARAQERRGG